MTMEHHIKKLGNDQTQWASYREVSRAREESEVSWESESGRNSIP